MSDSKYDTQGIAQGALEALWYHVAQSAKEHYGITTGDLPPEVDLKLGRAVDEAVAAWFEANAPRTASGTLAVELRIEMRPPKAGERGWWVPPDASADEILKAVLSDDDPFGWVADRDHEDVVGDDGLRAITVELIKADDMIAFPKMTRDTYAAQGFVRKPDPIGGENTVTREDEIAEAVLDDLDEGDAVYVTEAGTVRTGIYQGRDGVYALVKVDGGPRLGTLKVHAMHVAKDLWRTLKDLP